MTTAAENEFCGCCRPCRDSSVNDVATQDKCASDGTRTHNTAILSRLPLPIGLRRLEHLEFSALSRRGHTLRTRIPGSVTVRQVF